MPRCEHTRQTNRRSGGTRTPPRGRDRSPIEHVDEVERLIYRVHGVNDPRCPIEQARLFRDGLEDRGWTDGEDLEYTELDEEGHGSTDIEQNVRTYDRLGDYLERQL